MEARSEPRFAYGKPVKVWILGKGIESPLTATLANVSGIGMCLLAPVPIGLDTPVKVDLEIDGEDAMVLGDVIYCISQREEFAVGLKLQHSLTRLKELAEFMRSTFGERPLAVEPKAGLE
jgi:hypothetical protein